MVTGASRGIGLAVARRLVADGARVGVTARRPEGLAEAVAALGGPAHAVGVPGRADGLTARGGCVVNVSSIAGRTSSPGIAFYGVSKAAVDHLTAGLAVELAPTVRVNAVAPAVVRTRFAAALYADREDEVAGAYPPGRLGEAADVAAAVAFLASDEADWITGQTLVLDGGLTLTGRPVR